MKFTDISRLRTNRALNFKIAIIVTLSFVILAFNYTSENRPHEFPVEEWSESPEEIPVVRTATPKKKLPPRLILKSKEILPDEPTPEFMEEPLPEPVETTITAKTEVVELTVVPPKKEEQPVMRPELPEEDDLGDIVLFAEDMPRFPGCEEQRMEKAEKETCANEQLMTFLYRNLRYPRLAAENEIEGTVVIGFVIEKNGQISNVEILRDIGGGCGAEALRVVRKMPEWIAGKQNGRKVRVQYRLPVMYKLK